MSTEPTNPEAASEPPEGFQIFVPKQSDKAPLVISFLNKEPGSLTWSQWVEWGYFSEKDIEQFHFARPSPPSAVDSASEQPWVRPNGCTCRTQPFGPQDDCPVHGLRARLTAAQAELASRDARIAEHQTWRNEAEATLLETGNQLGDLAEKLIDANSALQAAEERAQSLERMTTERDQAVERAQKAEAVAEARKQALAATENGLGFADYEEVLQSHRDNARALDVAMHGELGAAKQCSIVDLIGPAKARRAELADLRARLAAEETQRASFQLMEMALRQAMKDQAERILVALSAHRCTPAEGYGDSIEWATTDILKCLKEICTERDQSRASEARLRAALEVLCNSVVGIANNVRFLYMESMDFDDISKEELFDAVATARVATLAATPAEPAGEISKGGDEPCPETQTDLSGCNAAPDGPTPPEAAEFVGGEPNERHPELSTVRVVLKEAREIAIQEAEKRSTQEPPISPATTAGGETPRTDAAEAELKRWEKRSHEAGMRGSHLDSDDPKPQDGFDFARQLERELKPTQPEGDAKDGARLDWLYQRKNAHRVTYDQTRDVWILDDDKCLHFENPRAAIDAAMAQTGEARG